MQGRVPTGVKRDCILPKIRVYFITTARIGVNMNTAKLTLSIPAPLIADAHRISKKRGESISSMFARFVSATMHAPNMDTTFPPLTRRALQLAMDAPSVPLEWDWKSERDNLLAKRYGRDN